MHSPRKLGMSRYVTVELIDERVIDSVDFVRENFL